MTNLPGGEDSLLVRTDFSDEDAWRRLSEAVATESDEGFRAYVQVIDDRAWNGMSWGSLREVVTAGGEAEVAVLFVADRAAMGDEHPIQVVDLSDEARQPFRCMASELWSVDNNLNLANMDWEDFAEGTGDDGVFRGFP